MEIMCPKRPGTLIMLMAIALFVTAAVYAQDAGDQPGTAPSVEERHESNRHAGPPSPAMELDHLTHTMSAALLPLTDTQKVTILGIYEDHETAMKSLRQRQTSGAATAQEMRALVDSSRASVRAALTEPQAHVFDAMRPPARPKNFYGAGGSASFQDNEHPSNSPPTQPAPSSATDSPGGTALNDDNSLIDANTGGAPQSSPAQ